MMKHASIPFPDNLISKFEEGGKFYVEMLLGEYEKEDIRLNAYDDHVEIFAYRASRGETAKPGDHSRTFRTRRPSLRRRIEIPAYALIYQAKANFQDGRLVIDMPFKGVKV